MESYDPFLLFFILIMVVGFLAYVAALVNAAKTAKWVWFVLMLLMWPLFIFYLLIAYESHSDSHNLDSVQAELNSEPKMVENVSRGVDEDLFEAVRAGDLTRAKSLVASGANPRAVDVSGYTPVDYARGHGFSDIEKFLENA